jgi:hypothetical protein
MASRTFHRHASRSRCLGWRMLVSRRAASLSFGVLLVSHRSCLGIELRNRLSSLATVREAHGWGGRDAPVEQRASDIRCQKGASSRPPVKFGEEGVPTIRFTAPMLRSPRLGAEALARALGSQGEPRQLSRAKVSRIATRSRSPLVRTNAGILPIPPTRPVTSVPGMTEASARSKRSRTWTVGWLGQSRAPSGTLSLWRTPQIEASLRPIGGSGR